MLARQAPTPSEFALSSPPGTLGSDPPVSAAPPAAAGEPRARAGVARAVERVRSDPDRTAALADAWRALWTSRLVIWVGGVAAVLALGLKDRHTVFNPPGLTSGFGWLGDRLVAPAARWDSAWYLSIAQHGYEAARSRGAFLPLDPTLLGAPGGAASRAAFFPLYPALVGALGRLGMPLVLGGIAVSVGALAVALYGVHRLTTLEIVERSLARGAVDAPARETARMTVLLIAFFPMAFFLSAVYSESLYLALSVGVFWSARRGRFVIACALAGFAAATRSAGIVLLVPIVLLYLYGPRGDRPPDRPAPPAGWGLARRLRPRYRLRPDALAAALVPLGLAAYMGYMAASGGSATMPFHAQAVWGREFAGPLRTLWLGLVAAFDGVRQLASMQTAHRYFAAGHGNPYITAQHSITDVLFLLVAVVATVGVLRTLPFAYGAYVLVALAMPLSYPATREPLMSLPRFLVVLFPLFMWAGSRLAARPRVRAPVFALSTAGLLFFVAQFATWHWVA